MLRQQRGQHVLGGAVAGVLQLTALEALGTHLEQHLTGLFGEPDSESVVIGCRCCGKVSHGADPTVSD
ncbi:hypothetical protein GCM10009668_37530 [Nocardioides dubius]|uniref:Uncharacterized protein n=1 Tax=Nocardioides dubius TaxID=317019 RepID=A0ABN1U3G1_9ACTN